MAEIVAKDVQFKGHKGATINAYLVRPKAGGTVPGMLLHHEAGGLVDFPKSKADLLAAEGYCVLAPDMYSRIPHPVTDMKAAYRSMSDQQLLGDLDAAIDFLKTQDVFKSRFGIIGFCTGNPIVYGSHNPQIVACVSFYNQLKTDPEWNHPGNRNPMDLAETLQGAWLGLYGDQDSTIPIDQLKEFEARLKRWRKDYQLQIYPGAMVGHGFLNENGRAYKPDQAKDAWKKTLEFLDKHLKKQAVRV